MVENSSNYRCSTHIYYEGCRPCPECYPTPDIVATLRADLAAALERVGELVLVEYAACYADERDRENNARDFNGSIDEWESRDGWQFADRNAERVYFFEQGIATGVAGCANCGGPEERDQLKRERDEAIQANTELNAQLLKEAADADDSYRQGFEDCREASAVITDSQCGECSHAISALTVPERGKRG